MRSHLIILESQDATICTDSSPVISQTDSQIKGTNKWTQDVSTITVNSVSNYSINVTIRGVKLSFLVDTGAAVSFIDGKIWDTIQQLKIQ